MARNQSRLVLVLGLAAWCGWAGGSLVTARVAEPQDPPRPAPTGGRGQPMPTTGTGFIAGQVVDPAGRGIEGAIVRLNGGASGIVQADSRGRFFFNNLPARQMLPQASKTGYLSAPAGVPSARPIQLAEGERVTDVRLRLVKVGIISGVVRDEGGDPVVGVDVVVTRRLNVGGRQTWTQNAARTDDRGAYRIVGLVPGEYVVCACRRDPIPFDGVLLTTLASEPLQLMGVASRALKLGADAASLDSTLRTFAPTFHPASQTFARAARVALSSGEEKTSVDVNVSATRAVRVSGTVVGANSHLTASSIRLVPATESDDASPFLQLNPVLVQPGGRFDFAAVPPGQYVLHVNPVIGMVSGPTGDALRFIGARAGQLGRSGGRAPVTNEAPLWAAESITVGDQDLVGLTIALQPAVRISGRLEFSGAGTPPAANRLRGGGMVLEPLPSARGAASGGGSDVTENGTFQFWGVPGRYVLHTMFNLQDWPTLKSTVAGGRDLTDLPIEVEAGGVGDIVVTLTDTPPSTISGTVTASARVPFGETIVLIFPVDRRLWVDPAAATRRFRSAPVTRTGSFASAAIVAGEYFIVAVPDDAVADWQDVRRLESLSRTAQRIQIADGEKKIVDVKR